MCFLAQSLSMRLIWGSLQSYGPRQPRLAAEEVANRPQEHRGSAARPGTRRGELAEVATESVAEHRVLLAAAHLALLPTHLATEQLADHVPEHEALQEVDQGLHLLAHPAPLLEGILALQTVLAVNSGAGDSSGSGGPGASCGDCLGATRSGSGECLGRRSAVARRARPRGRHRERHGDLSVTHCFHPFIVLY